MTKIAFACKCNEIWWPLYVIILLYGCSFSSCVFVCILFLFIVRFFNGSSSLLTFCSDFAFSHQNSDFKITQKKKEKIIYLVSIVMKYLTILILFYVHILVIITYNWSHVFRFTKVATETETLANKINKQSITFFFCLFRKIN